MLAKCKCKNISKAKLTEIIDGLPEENIIDQLCEFFRVFGDSTRLRILYFLSCDEFCVADLSNLVGMQQSAVSHQLQTLRLHRLVKCRKEGTTSYYSLDDSHVQEIFGIALKHINEVLVK
ncbi:MAG TPA: metalloregulator ArsR/SmtB family transcription factor [Candidatus Syntrophosphaera thermopropionivorans]|jgi:ArsR family transcriptional regulator|nr:metalloregulator ArsR/SmtB family transcription factor [Candidatus Syntrophosphaera thermopropionivorans]